MILQPLEKQGKLSKDGFDLVLEDVLISSEDIPGLVSCNGGQSDSCPGYHHHGRSEKRRYST